VSGALRQRVERVRAFFRGHALDRDLREELSTHLSLAADEYVRRGATPDEARRLAALDLGGVDTVRERHRDARGLPTLDSLLKDLAYALRGFRREPAFTVIALAILALGIGANTAVFSVVNPLLLRPLPFPDADGLMWIAKIDDFRRDEGLSGRTFRAEAFEALQRENRSFESMSAYFAFFGFDNFTLTGHGDAERLSGVKIAPRFFEVLGVQPTLGRLFTAEELAPNGPRAIVLSHAFWERRFAADPTILAQTLSINHTPVRVVGVLPPDFDFASTFTPGVRVDFFEPANLTAMRDWGNTLSIVGRLKPGVSQDQAKNELDALTARLKTLHPHWGSGFGVRASDLKTYVSGSMQRTLAVLWSAVGLVLLIVCANLSNLLLARTSARRKEIALRMALGAGRGRVVRQLLTEGVVLSLTGAALGVPLAYALTQALKAPGALSLPLLHRVQVDSAALLFTAAIAVLAGVIFGALPALRVSSRDPHTALKEQHRGSTDGPGQSWVRSALVVAEVALACVLLVGAGLLLRSFVRLLDVDLGFQPSRAIAVRIDRTGAASAEQRQVVSEEISRRVRALPGVTAAGLTDALPLDRNRTWDVQIPGTPGDGRESVGTFVYFTGPGYFQAMGIPLKAGRDFSAQDSARGQRVLIVNETLARHLYPDGNALGRLAISGDRSRPFTIVGIVADVRQTTLEDAPPFQMYMAEAQGNSLTLDLIVRSTLPPASLASSVRAAVGAVDRTLVTTDVRPIEDLVERAVSPRRFLLTLLGGFSLLALLLACLGIYGVVSYGVSQRAQEIGVRMALGATARDVARQIIGGTLRLTLIGVGLGVAVSLLAARLMSALLFGTSQTDALTFGGTALILTVVALLAGAVPALRAARIDPITALRAD